MMLCQMNPLSSTPRSAIDHAWRRCCTPCHVQSRCTVLRRTGHANKQRPGYTAITTTPNTTPAARPLPVPVAAAKRQITSSGSIPQALPAAHQPKSGAVIVGGGPAGLAAALMLAQRGWSDITVLEKRASFTTADSDKAFVYMMDGRSAKLLQHLGLDDQLPVIGWQTNEANVICAHPDGSITRRIFPIKDKSIIAHYVHRVRLLTLLVNAAQQRYPHTIQLISGIRNLAIHRVSSSNSNNQGAEQPLVVEADVADEAPANSSSNSNSTFSAGSTGSDSSPGNSRPGSGSQGGSSHGSNSRHIVLRPQLLLGCDGVRSTVRDVLAAMTNAERPGSDRFGTVEMPSPSTGLRFKVLELPPSPAMRSGERLMNDSLGLIYSRHKPKSLAMWPVKDPTGLRSANLVVYADDPVWDITDAEGMYAWMGDNFPQADMRALVPLQLMAAYAASRGGYFPVPQYSKTLGCFLPDTPLCSERKGGNSLAASHHADASNYVAKGSGGHAAAATAKAATAEHGSGVLSALAGTAGAVAGAPAQGCGALLLGDAAHSFPPDMAAGVNSALEDVSVLERALADAHDDVAGALRLYEQRRTADVRALVRLAQIGGPYQYGVAAVRKKIWQMLFVVQLLLNQALPWVFHPPIMIMIQHSEMPYREILRRADVTAARVKVLLVAWAALAAGLGIHMLGYGSGMFPLGGLDAAGMVYLGSAMLVTSAAAAAGSGLREFLARNELLHMK